MKIQNHQPNKYLIQKKIVGKTKIRHLKFQKFTGSILLQDSFDVKMQRRFALNFKLNRSCITCIEKHTLFINCIQFLQNTQEIGSLILQDDNDNGTLIQLYQYPIPILNQNYGKVFCLFQKDFHQKEKYTPLAMIDPRCPDYYLI